VEFKSRRISWLLVPSITAPTPLGETAIASGFGMEFVGVVTEKSVASAIPPKLRTEFAESGFLLSFNENTDSRFAASIELAREKLTGI
jgi:hypothetical protein